jgi:hypothetical protein
MVQEGSVSREPGEGREDGRIASGGSFHHHRRMGGGARPQEAGRGEERPASYILSWAPLGFSARFSV